MVSAFQTAPISKSSLLAGRIITTLAVLFLLFDGVTKVLKVAPVMEASARLGIPESVVPGIGIALLICTIVYVVPRTSVLRAILLTGFLGGAIATHVRVGGPIIPIVFAVTFGLLVWLGLYLRDDRLRTLIPLRG
jgi:hypothetical protein